MTFAVPKCPTCGEPARATFERVHGWALLTTKRLAPDEFEYEGETKIDWNTQQTERVPLTSEVILQCIGRHQWVSQMEGD